MHARKVSLLFILLLAITMIAIQPVTAQDLEPVELARIGLSGPIAQLDPSMSTGAPSYQPMLLISGQLFRFGRERELVPELAQSWEVSEDGLTYTITLNTGLLYSDGTPITIDDYLYAWQRCVESTAINKTLISTVESLEAPDDSTLVFTLSSPQPEFMKFFGFQYMLIHPREQLEPDPVAYFAAPVSSGPYMIADWAPGSPIAVLTENPNYVNGPMMIKNVEIVSVPDLTSRTLQLAQGDLDYVFDLAPSVRGIISEDVETFPHPIAGVYHINFNLSLPEDHPLMNRDVREVISLAIDREAVSQRAFFGLSGAATSYVYPGVPEQLNNLPNGGARDLEAAQALLATTPFAEGFEFRLGVWGTRPGWRDAVLVMKENLAELNIIANIESMEDAVAIAQLNNGDYEAQFSGNASAPVITFLGNLFRTGGSWANWSRYSSPEMDSLFEQIPATLDPEERLQLYFDIQELAYQDMPFIPVSERVVLSGTRLPREILQAVVPGEYIHIATVAELAGA